MKKIFNVQRTALLKVCSAKTFRIMKLTNLLLLVTVFNAFGSKTYSQSTKLNLDLKDVSIQSVLSVIEGQSEFFFLYSSKMIDVNQKVNIQIEGKNITEVLDELLASKDIKYTVKDRQILLVKKESETEPQQQTVTGKVTDSQTGEAMPGVNVVVKGTSIGAITDINGNYSIPVSDRNATLVLSFIGYISQEIRLDNRTTINAALSSDLKSLDEVLVVGYGTVLKKNITTSVSKITMDEIPKSASSNLSQLMVGRAAGLQATVASAQPGGNINISIRGGGTPIYVVDGVVVPSNSLEPTPGAAVTMLPNNVNRSGLAGLNPEDVESVEILKDASASIYGIGASQGVILITTKKSKEGPLKIDYSGSVSLVKNGPYVTPLDAQQYMSLINIFNKERYFYQNQLAPYGPTAYTSGWTPLFSETEIANAKTTNYLDEVLRNGSIANHSLNISGGTKTITYYVSGNYFKQTGSVYNSSMDRYSLRSNLVAQLTSFLKLTSIVNLNRNNYNNSSSIGGSSTVGAQGAGALINALRYAPNVPVYDPETGKRTEFRNVPNPVGMRNIEDGTKTNGVYTNFKLDLTIIKGMLNVRGLYGDNYENSRRSSYIPSDVYFDQMYKSRGNLSNGERDNKTFEGTLMFNKEFGNILNFDAVIGVGKYVYRTNGMNVAYNIQNDAIANDNLATITGVITPGSFITEDEKRSQFARINFDILDRYVINSTLRRDGTDKFFPGKKYAFFPSVSFAWKLSNESFMKGITWINLAKLRASYGETGSDNLGSRLYGTYSPSGTYVPFSQNTVKYIPIISQSVDYPDVTWEHTKMKNIGLDFSLFKDVISGSFDIFRNDITNMLGNDNTAGLSMYGTYPMNGGHIRREGWDANIDTRNIQNLTFSWTSTLTLSRFNTKWMERFPNYSYNLYEKQGVAPYYAHYFYEANGIINADLSNVPASQPESARKPGYPIIADRDGDGEITIADIQMTNEVPKIYFGFGNTFTYKNFDLDIFMYAKLGVHQYNYAWGWNSAGSMSDVGINQNSYAYRIWNSQTNPDGTFPGVAYGLASVSLPGGCGISTAYQDASFLRVRNITLGYNFTSKILGGVSKYISNIRVYVDAQNPILFTKFEGFDPEVDSGVGMGVNESVSGSGIGTPASLPQTSTYTVGVRINF